MKKWTTLTSRIVLACAIVVSSLLPVLPTHAADGSGQALEIGPPVMNLTGAPGTTVNATINLRDISPTSLVVTGEINDFIASGEDGTPKILLEEGETSPYSFKSWMTPLPKFTIKSREVKTLPITITIPADASPGGYYGVVRFSATPPDLEGTGVSLSASLGSLILLRVSGDAVEKMSVEEFYATHNTKRGSIFETDPIVFIERLKNEGNIHEQPTGLVTVTDMFGNVVATLGVNQPTRDILPSSIRKFESSLDGSNIGNKILFGMYKAKLDVTYGANKQAMSSEITFWVIPYTLIIVGILGLVAAFFLFRFLIRRYNRSITNRVLKAQGIEPVAKPAKKPKAKKAKAVAPKKKK